VARLAGDGEDDLEMRLLGLATGHLATADHEAGAGDERANRLGREARVALPVGLGDVLMAVLVEREEHQAPPGRSTRASSSTKRRAPRLT